MKNKPRLAELKVTSFVTKLGDFKGGVCSDGICPQTGCNGNCPQTEPDLCGDTGTTGGGTGGGGTGGGPLIFVPGTCNPF